MQQQPLDLNPQARSHGETRRPFADGVPSALDPEEEALLRRLMTPLTPDRSAAILDRVVGPVMDVIPFAPPRSRPFADRVPASIDPAEELLLRELMTPLAPDHAAAILDRVVEPQTEVLTFAPPRATKPSRLTVAVSLSMAAAAALLMVKLETSSTPAKSAESIAYSQPEFSADSLDDDAYEITFPGAPGGTRGAEGALPSFSAGAPVVVRLRARDSISGPIRAKLRAIHGTSELALDWDARLIGEKGNLEIHGQADDLLTTAAGTWELEVTLYRDAPGAPLWQGSTRLRLISGPTPRP